MIGSSPMNAAATVIIFGRARLTAPCRMASSSPPGSCSRPLLPELLVGQVEEQQHEDAGLGVEAEQRDHAHPGRDRHVVAEQVEEPDGADRRERAPPP